MPRIKQVVNLIIIGTTLSLVGLQDATTSNKTKTIFLMRLEFR
jgi:hypothetical protein